MAEVGVDDKVNSALGAAGRYVERETTEKKRFWHLESSRRAEDSVGGVGNE